MLSDNGPISLDNPSDDPEEGQQQSSNIPALSSEDSDEDGSSHHAGKDLLLDLHQKRDEEKPSHDASAISIECSEEGGETLSEQPISDIDSAYTRFQSYLKVVSLPAFFTNLFWRAMNLTRHPNVPLLTELTLGLAIADETAESAWQIALPIFILSAGIDAIRQMYQMYTPWKASFAYYWENGHYWDSATLGLKFFAGALGFTIAYTGAAKALPGQGALDVGGRALSAGIGDALALLITCEVIEILRKCRGQATNHANALRISAGGFWEGIVWSLVGDANIAYLIIEKSSGEHLVTNINAKWLDSVAVGGLSALAFALSAFITTSIEKSAATISSGLRTTLATLLTQFNEHASSSTPYNDSNTESDTDSESFENRISDLFEEEEETENDENRERKPLLFDKKTTLFHSNQLNTLPYQGPLNDDSEYNGELPLPSRCGNCTIL